MDESNLIHRPTYLEKLLAFQDKHLIKIITGIRRCGKSTLFVLFINELLKQGVSPEQILSINLEDPIYRDLLDWKQLYDHISRRLTPGKKSYVFIDEIQNIEDFQKAADGLYINTNVDLYLTGSNSKIHSGEWATLLSGRFIEIHMLPLSFKEYDSAYPKNTSTDEKFRDYLSFSAFPQILHFMEPDSSYEIMKTISHHYIEGIYSTVILKDVAESGKIKDLGRLESLIRFIASTIGSEVSVKKISDTMTSDGIKMLPLTVESYLSTLRDSFIIYRADRYDVKGKQLLKTLNKFYLVDMGIRRFLLGENAIDSGHILENIVYLELLRRNHKVYIGKVGEREVDFVTESVNGTEYYQVAQTVLAQDTLDRELSSLKAIKDHNPKYLLTRDYDIPRSHNGIKQLNVLEWLLG